jgi:hypothetical protein
MHLSEPGKTPLDEGVLALFLIQWITILFTSFVVFYCLAYV